MPAMGFQMESPESLLSDFSKVLKDDISASERLFQCLQKLYQAIPQLNGVRP